MTGGSSSEDQTNTITSQNAHHQHKGQEEEGKERNNNCSRGESNKHDDGVNEGMFTSTQRVQHDQRVNAEANIANPHRSSGRTTTESGGSSPLRRSKRDTNVGHDSVVGLNLVCLRFLFIHNTQLVFVFRSPSCSFFLSSLRISGNITNTYNQIIVNQASGDSNNILSTDANLVLWWIVMRRWLWRSFSFVAFIQRPSSSQSEKQEQQTTAIRRRKYRQW